MARRASSRRVRMSLGLSPGLLTMPGLGRSGAKRWATIRRDREWLEGPSRAMGRRSLSGRLDVIEGVKNVRISRLGVQRSPLQDDSRVAILHRWPCPIRRPLGVPSIPRRLADDDIVRRRCGQRLSIATPSSRHVGDWRCPRHRFGGSYRGLYSLVAARLDYSKIAPAPDPHRLA